MSLPQIFSFDNHAVRTIEKDGDVWFVAADVTDVLGYKNGRDAIAKHCKGVADVAIHDGSQNRTMSILPERDLYRLIMKSKLPAAEKFENWVVSEVLPAIRKTGTYTPPATPELQLAHAMLLAGRMIEEQKVLLDQRDKFIATIQPKANIADRISISEGLFGFRQVAKMLQINENKFKSWLVQNGWIYYLGKRMTVKHHILKQGFAETKIKLIQIDNGDEKAVVDMYITSKGVHFLASQLCPYEMNESVDAFSPCHTQGC